MAANVVDYEALKAVKAKINKKFDEMLENLRTAKYNMDQLNQETWTGASSDAFNEIFNGIVTKINAERQEFNQTIDDKLAFWYNEFQEAEKQQIQAANNM